MEDTPKGGEQEVGSGYARLRWGGRLERTRTTNLAEQAPLRCRRRRR